MSKRYTVEHKAAVLALLDANGGSISLTASQCGISERTLHSWKRARTQPQQHAHELLHLPQPQQEASELRDGDEIVLLRTYVMESAMRIAAALSRDLESPILFHKVNALNGLLDRLTKIEKHFPSVQKPKVVIVRYGYDDDEKK